MTIYQMKKKQKSLKKHSKHLLMNTKWGTSLLLESEGTIREENNESNGASLRN